jgi:purine-cytosine permease-like protein
MPSRARGAILPSVLGIIVCGGFGGVAAWAFVTMMGWTGAFGAIAAAIIAMIVAMAVWTAGASFMRKVRRGR